MYDVYALVYDFKGSHYDFGRYQAEMMLKTPFLDRLKNWYRSDQSAFDGDSETIAEMLETFAPDILDEINGLSDGLGLSLETALALFSGYYSDIQSGCSVIMKDDYFIRNYDQNPTAYDGRIVLFKPSNSAYATLGPSMLITGRTDGMNEHGLVVAYNFVTKRHNKPGFMCNIITRIILESCKNVEEAISLLKKIPHKTSFNYCLYDTAGESVVVEASAQETTTRKDHVSTNHFLVMTHENHKTIHNSVVRYKLLKEKVAGNLDISQSYSLMNDSDSGVFAHNYHLNDGTLHTAVYSPKTRFFSISYGANRKPAVLDFQAWLNNQANNVTKIRGKLETHIVFGSQN